MNDSALESQFRAFLQILTQPMGLLGILVVLMVCVAQFITRASKWWVLLLAVWVSTLAFHVSIESKTVVRLLEPFETLRSQSRPICLAMLAALTISVILSHRGWRRHTVGWPILTLFVFQILLAIRITMSDVSSRGVFSLMIFLMIFLIFGFGLGRWLQDWKDARAALRVIVFTALLFLFGTCIHLLFTPGNIIRQNRLYGTTGNPQQAGLLLAGSIPVILYFVLRKQEHQLWRIALAAAGGFLALFLLWTGSRTSMLVCSAGIVILFRRRIGRFLVTGLLVGVFGLLGVQIYKDSTAAFTDMFKRGDTRSHVWSAMYQNFLENKMWGGMGEQFGVGENSYLSVASSMGFFGLVPMFLFIFVTAWQIFRLQRIRKRLGDEVMMADLCTAALIALAMGGMFEGYLLGTLTFQVFCAYIFLAVMQFILDAVDVDAEQQQLPLEHTGEEMASEQQHEGVPEPAYQTYH